MRALMPLTRLLQWSGPPVAGRRALGMGALGVGLGLLGTELLGRWLLGASLPWFVVPMGASAVLLFAVPASPMAQPWPVVGGHAVSALCGVAAHGLLGESSLAVAVAGASAVAAMMTLRCLHPPGGALALTAVLGGPPIHALGLGYALAPVTLNSLSLTLLAVLFHRFSGHAYPHHAPAAAPLHGTHDPAPSQRGGITAADLDAALNSYGELLDIDRGDLEEILTRAQQRAQRRHWGALRCADIMSRDLKTAEFGTPLQDAWALLRRHHIKALPVVDRAQRVIGILTVADFMRAAEMDRHDGLAERLRRLLTPSPSTHSDKPEVVGQIMTRQVRVASAERPLAELVPLFADGGHHHIPIVGDEARLVGIITQSDLVTALAQGSEPIV